MGTLQILAVAAMDGGELWFWRVVGIAAITVVWYAVKRFLDSAKSNTEVTQLLNMNMVKITEIVNTLVDKVEKLQENHISKETLQEKFQTVTFRLDNHQNEISGLRDRVGLVEKQTNKIKIEHENNFSKGSCGH